MKVYSIFHVSLLKKASLSMLLCITIEVEHDEDEYEVEKILDVIHKKHNNILLNQRPGNDLTWAIIFRYTP